VITSITLENFKCFRKLEVQPRLITAFVGPNGSGKSSVLQALALRSLKPRGLGGSRAMATPCSHNGVSCNLYWPLGERLVIFAQNSLPRMCLLANTR